MTQETDILVIGAGPAGLGAAISAAKAGAEVLLVDENERAGGQLYKQIHKFFGSGEHYAGMRGYQIANLLLEEAHNLGVEVSLNSRALGLLDNGHVAVFRDGIVQEVAAKKVILAVGAKENGLPFPGWTLPGVMTAGAAQTFSNVHGTLVGEKILVVGSGNVGLIVSYQLMQAGAEIVALVEAAPRITGYQVHAGKIRRAGVPVYTSHTIVKARGALHVEEAVVAEADQYFQPVAGTEQTFQVDTILLAVGLSPRTELAQMFHCNTTYIPGMGGCVPVHNERMRSSNPGVYVCGDLAGVEEANTALDEGRLAGFAAAAALGYHPTYETEAIGKLQRSLADLRSGSNLAGRRDGKMQIIAAWENHHDE